jgi:hypothetical protein
MDKIMTNKKIKELYIKTLQTYPKTWTYDFDEDYAEIFANLIIDECIELCLKQRNPPNLNYKPSESFAEAICSYFEHKMPIKERKEKK